MRHHINHTTRTTLGLGGLLAAFAITTLGASAQQAPYQQSPAGPPPGGPQGRMPSYATNGEPTLRGTVSSVDGKYQIHVRDANGYIDNVTLHTGTIINPTGFPLRPGERVVIMGQPQGPAFSANEIDLTNVAVAPYGYGRYGYGYPVGIDVGFGFGYRRFGRGWW
ncbi:MAG: hypothetical protein IAI49_04850 [Candidatus Eremiobacteraeota bacterium]|nr:hypothetical protein [Candidatus Eremiobacteraeota bacterium]